MDASNYTQWLLTCLPSTSGRIMIVNLKTLQPQFYEQLAEDAHVVLLISPQQLQTALIHQHPNSTITTDPLIEFDSPTGCFKLMLIEAGLEQLDFLDVLYKAQELLKTTGSLVVIGKLHTKRPLEDHIAKWPLLKHLIAQANRQGFILKQQVTLSKKNARILLQFEKARSVRWKMLPIREIDQPKLAALFKNVFQQTLSFSLWQWKYGENRGVAVAVWQANQMIGHYGGMYRQLTYFGQPKTGIQIGDVMVTQQERARLTRHGPFYLSATTFSERHVGYGTAGLLPYGFPNARHMKIAKLLNIYEKVDDVVEIRWTSQPSKKLFTHVTQLKRPISSKYQKIIDNLWQEMQQDLKNHIAVVRDWPYIQYRYLAHPHKKYTLLLTKDWMQRPLGLIILSVEEDTCRLMDYIGELKHLSSALTQIRAYLATQNIKEITGWFSGAFSELWQQSGGQVRTTEITLPTIVWTPGPAVSDIANKWWLTTGDTDFL